MAPTIGFANREEEERARDLLREAGYTDTGLRELLRPPGRVAYSRTHATEWFHRTEDGAPLSTLARLFLLDVPVDAAAAERALAPLGVDAFARAGLVERRGDEVAGLVLLAPFGRGLFASDHPKRSFSSEFVVPVGQSSLLLARATVRQLSRRTLDVGTGCGVQAILAAPHSREVLATDRSPRAVALARLSAALSGVGNVRFAEGDGFVPAAGGLYDLIVCNPPYVIAPPGDHLFRYSGTRGDLFCRGLVRAAAPLLEEEGFAHFLANWPHPVSASWVEGLAGWFDDLGCDVLVWGGNTETASDYVLNWLGDESPDGGAPESGRHRRWLDWLEGEGIEAVSYGIITLHRRSGGKNFVHMDESPKPIGAESGGHVASLFRVLRFLEDRTFAELLDEKLRYSDRVRIERIEAPDGQGGWTTRQGRLLLAEGPVYSGDVEPGVAAFVARCDGTRTAGEILGEIASEMHIPFDRFAPAALNLVCHLLRRGFLLPGAD